MVRDRYIVHHCSPDRICRHLCCQEKEKGNLTDEARHGKAFKGLLIRFFEKQEYQWFQGILPAWEDPFFIPSSTVIVGPSECWDLLYSHENGGCPIIFLENERKNLNWRFPLSPSY
jgi:hypothetical protein